VAKRAIRKLGRKLAKTLATAAAGASAVALVSATTVPARAQTAPRRERFVTESGTVVLVEESHQLPMVDFQVTLRTGSAHDPEDQEGVARMTARMVRMGTRRLRAADVEERIDALGGTLGIETAPSYTRFSGSVIKRNVGPFLELVAQLLTQPALRAADLAQVQRETLADIVELRDNDRGLASREFRRAVFGTHPYGRAVLGTPTTVARIDRAAIVQHFETHYVAKNAILGLAGDVDEREARDLVARYFSRLRTGDAPSGDVPPPRMAPGRRVVLVDKPGRTQTQVYVGGLGTRPRDADHFPLVVANTVFGGTFTARLMREIRSVRGWSYGAYSRLSVDRQRDAWLMWTFPAAADAVSCVRLELELFDALLRDGITAEELRFAQDYLANSYAFEVDTASKRLEQRIEVELLGLPRDYFDHYVESVRAVTLEQANAAVRARLSRDDLAIVMVATASDVREGLTGLDGVASVDVVPFDRD
jgi:zinc protease